MDRKLTGKPTYSIGLIGGHQPTMAGLIGASLIFLPF